MKLPGGHNAIVEIEKLSGYCLNPNHPRGKHKARVFATVVGFTAQNANDLRALLLEAAADQSAESTSSDQFGSRYVIDFLVAGPTGAGTVRSTWILRHNEETPPLTGCYVK